MSVQSALIGGQGFRMRADCERPTGLASRHMIYSIWTVWRVNINDQSSGAPNSGTAAMRDWPVASNPPFQLTPLRVEQDRGFFNSWNQPKCFPSLWVRRN